MAPRPKHEQVADAYTQQSSAPPSTGRIRGAKRENKRFRTQNPPRQQVAYRDSVRNTKIKKRAPVEEPEIGIAGRNVRRQYTRLKHQTKKLPGKAADLKLRAKASATNISIWSWGIPLWLTFQLPFAIISNVMFGIATVQMAVANGVEEFFEAGEDGVVAEGAKALVRFVWGAATYVADTANGLIAEITGFDIAAFLEAISPVNLWGVTFTLFFAYAFFLFLLISTIYSFRGLRPIFGKGTTFKLISIIIMIAGYVFPLTNMFPWFMLWTAVVWRYPK